MSLTMDESQYKVAEDEYSDELKELNQTREILRQAIQEPVEEIEEKLSLTDSPFLDVNKLTELRFTIEPSMLEIQDMDKKVQEIQRKLNLKAELLQEYKESRAFSGKVKMLLERASKREAQGSVPSTGQVRWVRLGLGSTNGQSQRSWGNHPSVDSPPSCPPQLFLNFGNQQRDYENQGLSFAFREPRSPPEQRPVVTTDSVRLPKINMMPFDGDIMLWTQFWDLFERYIDKHTLSDVNKFQYMKGLLSGQAANVIAQLLITEENYRPAVDALKQSNGHSSLLKRSHIAALKAVEPVYNFKDLNKLHKRFDDVDTHFKALSVLGVESENYSMAIMPDLMKKLPREIVISIKRLKDIHHEWTVAEFLEAFWNELILRGLNEAGSTKDTARDMRKGRVFSVTNKLCVFCLGEHQSNDCTKVTDIDERRKIVVKYKRCFQCVSEKGIKWKSAEIR